MNNPNSDTAEMSPFRSGGRIFSTRSNFINPNDVAGRLSGLFIKTEIMKKPGVLTIRTSPESIPTPESISTLAVMKWLEKVEPRQEIVAPEGPQMLKWLETIDIGPQA